MKIFVGKKKNVVEESLKDRADGSLLKMYNLNEAQYKLLLGLSDGPMKIEHMHSSQISPAKRLAEKGYVTVSVCPMTGSRYYIATDFGRVTIDNIRHDRMVSHRK